MKVMYTIHDILTPSVCTGFWRGMTTSDGGLPYFLFKTIKARKYTVKITGRNDQDENRGIKPRMCFPLHTQTLQGQTLQQRVDSISSEQIFNVESLASQHCHWKVYSRLNVETELWDHQHTSHGFGKWSE